MEQVITTFVIIFLTTVLAADKSKGFRRAMVASDSLVCSEVGRDILLKNGSAVDAAIASLLCLSVTVPESTGIGGGFLMTIYNKEKVEVLDARETAPLKARKRMYNGKPNASSLGGLSIAVPSLIKGLEAAHKKHGVLKWHVLFESAINISKNGFVVSKHIEKSINRKKDKIIKFHALRNLLWNRKANRFYKVGDIMKNSKLSETLSEISRDGAKKFYAGDLAKKLIKDIKHANGIITEKDLKTYRVRWRSPIQVKMPKSLTLNTFPLPGSGALLALMLNIMKGYQPKPNMTTADKIIFYHRAIETFKYAFGMRIDLEDSESPSVKRLTALLTSESYAESIRKKIVDNRTFSDPMHYEMIADETKRKCEFFKDHGTSHLSIVAPNGDAVSVTSTINDFFGSMVVSPSTGILLNNEMDDFSSPNLTNVFGVPTTPANSIYPGRRPMSSMVPSIFLNKKKQVKLVIGGVGGTKISTSVTQVIMSNVWVENNIATAIFQPRLHNQLTPVETDIESNFPEEIAEGLKLIGHKLKNLKKMASGVFAIVRGSDGLLYGSGDARKGGGVAGF